jgi:hypothetical protein
LPFPAAWRQAWRQRQRALVQALEAAPTMDRIVLLKGWLTAGLVALRTGDLAVAEAQIGQAMHLASQKTLSAGASAWVGAAKLLQMQLAIARGQTATAREHRDAARAQFAGTLPADHWLRQYLPSEL